MQLEDHDRRDFSHAEWAILRSIHDLKREIAHMDSEEQADFAALQATVQGLQTDEHEVAAEFTALAEKIEGLSSGQVTAAQINELNAEAVALGEKLKGDVAGAQA